MKENVFTKSLVFWENLFFNLKFISIYFSYIKNKSWKFILHLIIALCLTLIGLAVDRYLYLYLSLAYG